jgi:hypothetical protein
MGACSSAGDFDIAVDIEREFLDTVTVHIKGCKLSVRNSPHANVSEVIEVMLGMANDRDDDWARRAYAIAVCTNKRFVQKYLTCRFCEFTAAARRRIYADTALVTAVPELPWVAWAVAEEPSALKGAIDAWPLVMRQTVQAAVQQRARLRANASTPLLA